MSPASFESKALLCNFFGTLYGNSSREVMLATLNSAEDVLGRCFVSPRLEWTPKETEDTRQRYVLDTAFIPTCPSPPVMTLELRTFLLE
jgi:hypothetical protein